VAAGAFDAVLMDIRMPGMNGFEATRRIRQLSGLPGQIPVIALTAHAFADQIEACRRAGMDAHLAKPFTPQTLAAALARGIVAAQERIAGEACPPLPAGGAGNGQAEPGLAVLDQAAFDGAASVLVPAAVASHLQALASRAEGLLAGLHAWSREGAGDLRRLAAEAHTLAGAAGLFGFRRLAAAARLFERAVQTEAGDVPVLLGDLIAAAEATLETARRLPVRAAA
jgi:HPt (histidine-containing phosphotransfer) domain-containing protein